jgi:putative transcriptional regulator
MNKFAKDLIQSLSEAVEISQGKRAPARITIAGITAKNVRTIRNRLKMSQQTFSKTYRIPLPILKKWEQKSSGR